MFDEKGIARAFFVFFAGIPFVIFRICYFLYTFPRFISRRRQYLRAPKSIQFQRLSDRAESLLSVVALTNNLRMNQIDAAPKKPPRMFDLAQSLWEEEESTDWKIPTVAEVWKVSDQLLLDINAMGSNHQEGYPSVWALDEDTQMFMVVDLMQRQKSFATPENLLTMFCGDAPESIERCYGYAVRVIPQMDKLEAPE